MPQNLSNQRLPYEEGAALVAGDVRPADVPAATKLLTSLGYQPADRRPLIQHNRSRLLAFAARMKEVLPWRAPDAPKLHLFLGQFCPSAFADGFHERPSVSVIGAGLDISNAFERCVGEAAEYASQLEHGNEILSAHNVLSLAGYWSSEELAILAGMLGLRNTDDLSQLSWISATRLRDGSETFVPADLCLRRRPARLTTYPAAPLSVGCAAGPTFESALLSALLEIVERDAAALWWRAGKEGAHLSLESLAENRLVNTVLDARSCLDGRLSWLLDISIDLGIPCVAAMSTDPGGQGFACGLSAGLTVGDAASGVLREMFQWELGHHIVAMKRRLRGDDALNSDDRRQLRRKSELHPDRHPILRATKGPKRYPSFDDHSSRTGIDHLTQRLQLHGIEAYYTELTRPGFGIPVVRAIAPLLQVDPSSFDVPRFRAAAATRSSGPPTTFQIPLH